MKTYCVKCRKDTENIDPEMVRTKIIDYLCNQNVLYLGIKTPLSKIPLLDILF